jgi:hypothetical protein
MQISMLKSSTWLTDTATYIYIYILAPLTMVVLVHVFGFAAEGVSTLTSAMPPSADATKHSLSLVSTLRFSVCVALCMTEA